MSTTVAAAEAALRYNIRPLTPRVPESLRHALARLDGAGDPEVLTGDAALGALGVEGLHPDQVGALRRAVEAEGGRAVIAPDGRAVLLGPSTSLAGEIGRASCRERV